MLLLVLALFCWGTWATTFKMTGPKWRFELYYYDFAIGVVLATVIAGLTFGSLGWDGFSFIDDLRNAGKRQDLFGFLGGCVFNLGNMLMLASVSLAGMSVAFPICLGVGLVIGSAWSYFLAPAGNPLLLLAGCFCVLVSAGVSGLAFKTHTLARLLALVQQGKTKSTKKTFSPKGVILAVAGGVMMGSFNPLVNLARETEVGLGPYGVAFVFAGGMAFTSFVYNLFFMNLPVQGKPVDFSEYFKGGGKAHYLGLLGGLMWAVGMIAILVVGRADGPALMPPPIIYAMTQGATLLGTLWGLIYWGEFEGSDSRVKALLSAMLVLLVVGAALVSVAPVYSLK